MTSYLIDGFLLLALMVTTWRVVVMYRQLKILSSHHEDYKRIFDQTSDAMDQIGVSLQELKVRGEEIVSTLGKRIDDARDVTMDLNALIAKAQNEAKLLQDQLAILNGSRTGRQSGARSSRTSQEPAYHIPDELGGNKDESGKPKRVTSVADMLGAERKSGSSEGLSVSTVDNQSVRVRKVTFGQGVSFRTVNSTDKKD
ncbi:hypothetical protein E1162_06775 [Rhodobacteraceae bacterium RKSG542]|uniref:hypothetical protein n=1 Tax=Pseudovibrio flavus TaxID=2529854 RepID=UPI0012BB4B06|nr:hypothetical protein [Pseudovibrio flavus]MTI16939.1 hypothetical protein [Pseudovibrio flavus]